LLSSAQFLSPEVRNTVSRRFDVPVVNYYASTETGPIAWECLEGAGRFHVLLPHVWVESIEGELLVTRLRPSPFLLLRYRIGDRGEVFRDDCDCGYRGLTITNFGGRCTTRFLTPDGQTVDPWKLAYLFKYQPVRSFRLIQTGTVSFRLEISSASGQASPYSLISDLTEGLRRLGFPSPVIDVAILGDELDSRSKFDPFAREEFQAGRAG
jgi:phenylacetate-CoA ligase